MVLIPGDAGPLWARQFVEDVGGTNLDDTSEILGGVKSVMGRLDTDSDDGIGLKELRYAF